ncbi:MAG: hypothetical protein ACR2FK_00730, partial [Sphingomicrobium sp.]
LLRLARNDETSVALAFAPSAPFCETPLSPTTFSAGNVGFQMLGFARHFLIPAKLLESSA